MARSPAYPSMGLESAIERARLVYDKEKRNWVPAISVFVAMKYTGNSGPARSAIAALKTFGLLDERESGGNKEYRVSGLCYEILVDIRQPSPERDERLREAALLPPIHRQMWEKWHTELPSEDTITHWLRLGRSESEGRYHEAASSKLAKEYMETFSYARLDESLERGEDADKENEAGEVINTEEKRKKTRSSHTQGNPMGEMVILLSGGEEAVLRYPVSITDSQISEIKETIDFYAKRIIAAGNLKGQSNGEGNA